MVCQKWGQTSEAVACSICWRGIGTVIIHFPLFCSSRSFFQPKKEGKVKKPEKETSNSIREMESPPK